MISQFLPSMSIHKLLNYDKGCMSCLLIYHTCHTTFIHSIFHTTSPLLHSVFIISFAELLSFYRMLSSIQVQITGLEKFAEQAMAFLKSAIRRRYGHYKTSVTSMTEEEQGNWNVIYWEITTSDCFPNFN